MTGRVGAKGQIVIPKPLRDRVNLHPGDEVDFEFERGRLEALPELAALAARQGHGGRADRLLEDRRRKSR